MTTGRRHKVRTTLRALTRNRPINFFHLVFAIFPLLHLYTTNIAVVKLVDVIPALAIGVIATALLYLAFRIAFKDAFSAALLVTFIVILFYGYGHTHLVLTYALRIGLLHGPLIAMWSLLLALMVYAVAHKGRNMRALAAPLNVMAALLLIFSGIRIGRHVLKESNIQTDGARAEIAQPYDRQTVSAEAAQPSNDDLPDIYYIVLDEYARADILEEYYGYDNSAFTRALTDKGFYVATGSQSNYAWTYLSMAAALNMDYLSDPEDELRAAVPSEPYTYSLVLDSKVSRFLKDLGYTYVHVSSGWGPTDTNPFADSVYRLGRPSIYADLVFEASLMDAFHDRYADDRDQLRYALDLLATMPEVEGPKFVFAHIYSPHVPYLFDQDGNPLPRADVAQMEVTGWRGHKSAYIQQVMFLNHQIEAIVDELLVRSAVPPIIIVQGDHGTAVAGSIFNPTEQASDGFIYERMRILNAYYLPGSGSDQLYPSISPVNSFRVILDTYFGTEFGQLEDRSYFSAEPPFEFVRVTYEHDEDAK